MKHSNEAIKMVKAFGYNEEEAVNILDGKNPDGTEFIKLPF